MGAESGCGESDVSFKKTKNEVFALAVVEEIGVEGRFWRVLEEEICREDSNVSMGGSLENVVGQDSLDVYDRDCEYAGIEKHVWHENKRRAELLDG